MKISFSRYIVDTMRICDFTEDEHRMLTCRYEFLGENGLIGQFEYFGELAYFTIDNNTFKIETGFDFSYLIPFTRSFLKESKSGKKIGSFSNFGKGFTYNKRFENPSEILTLKQTAPTYKSRQGLNDNSPRNYVFSNKKLVINYTYETEDSSNRMFYTQKLKGEIEYDNTLDLTAVYSGIYLIEPMIGNFSYSRSASTT